MKVTKSDLKSIVKECLVEILSEGISTTQKTQAKSRPVTQPLFTESVKRQPSIQSAAASKKVMSSQLREAVRREAAGDDVMAEILADTAASTLPKMMQNEGKAPIAAAVGGGLAERVVAEASPEDLFGDDVASKWANLAFLDSPIKK